MIITTTNSVDGHKIAEYHGVIAGQAVMGVNIFKDFFADIRNIVGGRTASYEAELEKARQIALAELEEKASELGANAVVGVDLDYEVIGGNSGSMLMVSASGTAVTCR